MITYAFIDASNLFYGGEKSLGWKIDYQKLLIYLKDKYKISKALYFGGVEIHNFDFNYLKNDTVSIENLERYLTRIIKEQGNEMTEAMLLLSNRHLQRIRFYLKLEKFGYELHLKPVKLYEQDDGTTKRKANCDVDMAFYLMKEKDNFNRATILSGDGDFLPVLKYLKDEGKEIIILARGPRTAKEIRQFAGGNFRDFVRLEKYIRFEEK
jgi:uncharacterized LabA/DUF88 family protein